MHYYFDAWVLVDQMFPDAGSCYMDWYELPTTKKTLMLHQAMFFWIKPARYSTNAASINQSRARAVTASLKLESARAVKVDADGQEVR
jgi:hypothetical protein